MFVCCVLAAAGSLAGQVPPQPPLSIVRPSAAAKPGARKFRVQPPYQLAPGEYRVEGVQQERIGPIYHLRGHALVATDRFLIRADEIDYNEQTRRAEARGHVYMQHFEGGEELWADHAEYDAGDETGKFYDVHGSAPLHIEARPGVLTSSNPFYFQGRWAERFEDHYVLHDGFVTNCGMPNPWWVLRGPSFDVVPGDRAVARNTVFRLRKLPLFYFPYFRKSLERLPRQSGFLTPNIGNSSRRGKMIGIGYYWAINRSYDASYRGQLFTQRGIAHTVDFRGKPNDRTSFDAYLYGVNDRGLEQPNGERIKQGGFLFSVHGRTNLGGGWYGNADINYLSSFTFRQAFTESFNEAISTEVHSIGSLSKDWSSYNFDILFDRLQGFQFLNFTPDQTIIIRKLPEADFMSRDRRIWSDLPIWISWDSSAGLVRRKQPLYQTRQFLERTDLYPRVMTALRWKGFNFIPSLAIRESHWGESRIGDQITGQNINRHGQEVSLAIIPPSLERIYDGPAWLGEKLKHVIEPELSFRHVGGIDDFNRLIQFDETELYTNTTEAEISVTQRLYVKRKGSVNEVLSWQVFQRRYFDPDFGGAVLPGRRNVVLSALELTPYAFLDGPRNYSPIVSALRMSPLPSVGIEWRTDYDPLRSNFTNSTISGDGRMGKYFISVGHSVVRRVPLGTFTNGVENLLNAPANQFRGIFGIGQENRRGWNAAFSAVYDFRIGAMQYATTQVTYNTDCCGFSVQYRRLNFGIRNENQFRIAFAVANVGSFGTLKKQERLF